jgi:hypothetical protein
MSQKSKKTTKLTKLKSVTKRGKLSEQQKAKMVLKVLDYFVLEGIAVKVGKDKFRIKNDKEIDAEIAALN